jgi:uncharacterized protein
MDSPAQTVVDNPGKFRYEIYAGDELAGFVTYQLGSDVIAFLHTQVEPQFEGKGFASHLARAVLDDARKRGLSVLPYCPYVSEWIQRHPDYADLVPPPRRQDFGLA